MLTTDNRDLTTEFLRYTDSMVDLGRILIFLGFLVVVVGLFFLLIGKTNLPLGRFPGDILYRGKNTTFYFPLATSILLSVILSVALYIIGRFRH